MHLDQKYQDIHFNPLSIDQGSHKSSLFCGRGINSLSEEEHIGN